MKATLRQLSGAGIKGLEHCPPCYHVDFEADEFAQFLADPVGVLKELGYEMSRAQIILGRWNDAWSHRRQEWIARPNEKPVRGCCYVSDDSVICHPHAD
jgi:hypothetical protein